MTCLGCQLCDVGPFKTLIDGRVVCHQCEDWRAECEARTVARMPTIAQRRKFLELVEKHRGEAAAKTLRSDLARVWDSERPAGGGT